LHKEKGNQFLNCNIQQVNVTKAGDVIGAEVQSASGKVS
jgi:hypothetical protein